MDVMPRVSVVTVNFNHATYLAAYVESLLRSEYRISEIIIIDNASQDNSVAILAKYPQVKLIRNSENIGYSAALNQAFESASSQLVCATGPDVVVAADWLHPLVMQYLQKPETTFAVVSRTLTLDRSEIQSAGSSLHFTGHLCVLKMWQPVETIGATTESAVEVGAVDSTSVLIDREKFLAVGGCDPDFFVFHEEFDYCYRARMRGWQCWYQPASVVYHGDGSAGFSVRDRGSYPRERPYFHTRNRLLSILKDYQLRTLVGITPVLLVLEPLNILMLTRLNLQKAYTDALAWLWHHRGAIRSRRGTIQPTRRVQDRDLLSSDAFSIAPLMLDHPLLRPAKSVMEKALAFYWRFLKVALYR